jgi:hypothetical protein
MFEWIRKQWNEIVSLRRFSNELDPGAIRILAHELTELVQIIRKLLPRQHSFQSKLLQIEKEMTELDHLTSQAAFRRLSYKQKLLLRKSLIQSRDQLIEAARSAPSPTNYVQ